MSKPNLRQRRSVSWKYHKTCGINRIYNHVHFVQGQRNPPEFQRFAVQDEACRVMEVAYLWHGGWFPCPCIKWWLIIFLLSPLIAVRTPYFTFYLKNYYRTFSDHKTGPTRRRVIVKVITSRYDHHSRFVHNGVVGDKPLETSCWIGIKRMDIRVWGSRTFGLIYVLGCAHWQATYLWPGRPTVGQAFFNPCTSMCH